MKKIFLLLLGLIPFGLGFLLDSLMTHFSDVLFPYAAIGVCFLIFWGAIGFFMYRLGEPLKVSLIFAQLPAFLTLLLNLFQEIVLVRYWGNLLGAATQLYFLPVLNISFSLTFWADRVWPAYIAAFLLMCAVYYLGFRLGERHSIAGVCPKKQRD